MKEFIENYRKYIMNYKSIIKIRRDKKKNPLQIKILFIYNGFK